MVFVQRVFNEVDLWWLHSAVMWFRLRTDSSRLRGNVHKDAHSKRNRSVMLDFAYTSLAVSLKKRVSEKTVHF